MNVECVKKTFTNFDAVPMIHFFTKPGSPAAIAIKAISPPS